MGSKYDPTTIRECQHKLSLGRARAVKKLPFMTDAVYALIPWAAPLPPGVGMGVRKDGVLYYSPEVILEWTLDDVVTGIIHEAEHILRKHHSRKEKVQPSNAEHRCWALAVDAELGDDLEGMQLKLLDTDITPKRIDLPNGRLAEEYFDELRKRQQKQGSVGGKGKCECGSGSGIPYPNEDEFGGPEGLSQSEREVQLEQVREATATAIRQHGSAPANLKRWAELELTQVKKIPWEKQLLAVSRSLVAWKKGYVASTHTRTARRQAAYGYGVGRPVIPAYVAPIPNVALCQDTSGSMGEHDIQHTFNHAKDILAHCGGKVTFVSIDAAVHAKFKTSSITKMKQNLIGGGGTDFRPAFEMLKLERPRPDIIVFATDGYGSYPLPEEVTWCKTIWLITSTWNQVPFGTVIHVN